MEKQIMEGGTRLAKVAVRMARRQARRQGQKDRVEKCNKILGDDLALEMVAYGLQEEVPATGDWSSFFEALLAFITSEQFWEFLEKIIAIIGML